jgi:hypothetical protein
MQGSDDTGTFLKTRLFRMLHEDGGGGGGGGGVGGREGTAPLTPLFARDIITLLLATLDHTGMACQRGAWHDMLQREKGYKTSVL